MPADVLVVDDDPGLRELLDSGLAFAGYDVRTAASATEAFDRLRERRPDVVVLDVVLPGTDGLDVLRLLRSTGDATPVLLLTARDAVPDRVAGLTAGADDYLTKPFDLTELVARLEALLRRVAAHGVVPGQGADEERLTFADLELDLARMRCRRGDRELDLSPTELRLLTVLLQAGDRVVTKAQLLDRVWDYDFGGDAGVVEKVVSRLRRKVDGVDDEPLIHTVRGFGYALRGTGAP
ncbi:response regulator transcription factor [Cellulomonas soli]|nr:response regulator transcription factor [Cellulomonas soli]NYI58092.1 two-component system OmpR family response regulator [Cellulomonas soli]